MREAPNNMKTGPLVQEHREVLIALGRSLEHHRLDSPESQQLVNRSNLLEEEILRRMAW